MSLPAAAIMLVTNVLPPTHVSPVAMLQMRPEDIAAERALIMNVASTPAPGVSTDRQPRLVAPEDQRPDLVLLAGDRRHGAQVEFGALGGGRDDAPGLLHVGVGFDF